MAGSEQISKRPLVNVFALEQAQYIVPGHYQRSMTDQAIIAPKLNLFDQFQVLFAHFEKHFDVPAFAVQPYYFIVCYGNICW